MDPLLLIQLRFLKYRQITSPSQQLIVWWISFIGPGFIEDRVEYSLCTFHMADMQLHDCMRKEVRQISRLSVSAWRSWKLKVYTCKWMHRGVNERVFALLIVDRRKWIAYFALMNSKRCIHLLRTECVNHPEFLSLNERNTETCKHFIFRQQRLISRISEAPC